MDTSDVEADVLAEMIEDLIETSELPVEAVKEALYIVLDRLGEEHDSN